MRTLSTLFAVGLLFIAGCGGDESAQNDPASPSTSGKLPKTTEVVFNAAGAPTVEFELPSMDCEDCCNAYFEGKVGVIEVKFEDEDKIATVAYDTAVFDIDSALAALQEDFPDAKLPGEPEDEDADEAAELDETEEANESAEADE